MRELVSMYEAKVGHDWDQTSQVLSKLHNAHFTPPLNPDAFHPLKRKERKINRISSLAEIAPILTGPMKKVH